ncbi:hypothetical protein C9374_011326 [Naegleria lovaniensis]|uniref:Uncharacterized protein n=1 Tax=Naegleria lovaniensis TaxID=51637 RepID=A0AA88KQM7_NAELO|nr:uncharacterized protein C9374_011326 [Naegleria lovaniensis]KAG2392601.1 hypothetical protein C9374_011326 [Naegleria lovaniensis]
MPKRQAKDSTEEEEEFQSEEEYHVDSEPQHEAEEDESSLQQTSKDSQQPKQKKKKSNQASNQPKVIQLLFSKSFLSIEQACETIQTIIVEDPEEQLASIKLLQHHNAIKRLIELLTIDNHNPIIHESALALNRLFEVDENIFSKLESELIHQLLKGIILMYKSDHSIHPSIIYDHKESHTESNDASNSSLPPVEQFISTLFDLLLELIESNTFMNELLKQEELLRETCQLLWTSSTCLVYKEKILHLMYSMSREVIGLKTTPLVSTTVNATNLMSTHDVSNATSNSMGIANTHSPNTLSIISTIRSILQLVNFSSLDSLKNDTSETTADSTDTTTTTIDSTADSTAATTSQQQDNHDEKYYSSLFKTYAIGISNNLNENQIDESQLVTNIKNKQHLELTFEILHGIASLNNTPSKLRALKVFIESISYSVEHSHFDILIELLNDIFEIYSDEKGMEKELFHDLLPCLEKIQLDDFIHELKENIEKKHCVGKESKQSDESAIEMGITEQDEDDEEFKEKAEEVNENLKEYIQYIRKKCGTIQDMCV